MSINPKCVLCDQPVQSFPPFEVGGKYQKWAIFGGAQKYNRCPNCGAMFPEAMRSTPETIVMVNRWIQERLRPATKGLTPGEIKAALGIKQITQVYIAHKLKTTPGHVYQVIHGIRKTQRIREAIAEALEVPPESIWPA
jgi:lambda repressor-like predicted transcriptional regulator